MALSQIIACSKNNNKETGPERPAQPWVFRSVLDSQARMLTLALHDDLWVAYHTDSCCLYKAWKGYVHLQGAVYDNHHGPQPISIGDAWIENPFLHPWSVQHDGQEVLQEVRYAGHALHKGRAQLMYNLILKDGKTIRVNEQPEYVEKDGQKGLERAFTLEDLPDGYEVSIAQQVTSIALAQNIVTNGTWKADKEEKKDLEGRQTMIIEGRLTLNQKGDTYFTTYFTGQPVIPNENKVEGESEDLPLGQRLIAKNDCKTCHNEKVQTIGPSYKMIAERYPTNDASVATLTAKVIAGGSGMWGNQAMSPHPEIPETDVKEMVRYILAIDTADTGQEITEIVKPIELTTTLQDGKDLLPGLIVEVWTNQTGFKTMPTIPPNKRSNQAGIIQDLHNIDNNAFGGLEEDFVMISKGYLYAEKDTTAAFRIWSDDGSKVTIDGQLIIDNDGMHGTEEKHATVHLQKGYHPITIDFIQGKGGRFLSLEWKPAGANTWTGVPPLMFFHNVNDHSKLTGKTLSMVLDKKMPGDQSPLQSVHPSYTLTQARPDDFLPKVGGMDFLSDGKLVVSTWDPSGSVYTLTNVSSGDPSKIKVTRIASGLAEPLGLKVIHDTIYVLQKQELTRLIDTDKDGIIDEYQCVNNRWITSANFHEFAFGLAEKDGDLYGTLAIAILPGGASASPQVPSRGHVVKFDLPSGELSFIASGLRTPNGIGIGIDGEIFIADNQGDWLPSSKIIHVVQDAFYGQHAVDPQGTANLKVTPPTLWLPQDEIGNSPSTPLQLNDGPYKGQMIHCEVTYGGVERDFIEKINGEYQGCVFPFIQGLEAGINRMVWGPDTALYVGGIGNPGNWAQTDKLWYGLQRLKYNGKPTFEMLAVRAKTDGLEIEFTEPLRDGDGWDPKDWEIKQWRYVPTKDYGGPKVDLETLKVLSASVSSDRKHVGLKLAGMKAGHVVYVHMRDAYVSDAGRQLWTTEAWYTMNNIPENNPVNVIPTPAVYGNNMLTPSEQASGWKLLFDGKTTAGWHNFNKTTIGSSWKINDEAIMLDAVKSPDGNWQAKDGGDIVSQDEYENFELNLEWKISPCGNSGIIYNVVESKDYDYVWQTGPEMQVLDNTCHPDSRFATHRAGDLYDMIECKYPAVKPAGQWNKIRIIKDHGHVEHWMNGIKVLEFEMYTDHWKEMISKSKFKDMKGFGLAPKGKIALQDHGNTVWYRNIKIKPL
ncbi:MAG TPA: family 16 glycoside hydrolase [Saprospiraceae bacterium]|nr:family 16 glycoside hydrolase [Saprospiraceae bacterium]